MGLGRGAEGVKVGLLSPNIVEHELGKLFGSVALVFPCHPVKSLDDFFVNPNVYQHLRHLHSIARLPGG